MWQSDEKKRLDKTSGSHLQEDELTELDKIFLLLAESNLKDCFNILCYDLQVRTIADWQKLDEEALKRFRLLPNFAKDQLRTLPQKAEKTDFVSLALKHGKLPYKARLQASGVAFISTEDVKVVKKTATGPVSGSVFKAIWTKPNGEKMQVCLRYDRSKGQRDQFIHEADISAPLAHQSILNLYGVILPGLYTDSVALVLDYAECGNIREAMPKLSVFNLIQMITQLASALEYLNSKNLIHSRISTHSIYVAQPGKLKLGGFWSCQKDKLKEV